MTEAITLDEIDTTAASAIRGVRRSQGPRPAVQGRVSRPDLRREFLIGRYCATTDPEEIEEGLQVVRRTRRPHCAGR